MGIGATFRTSGSDLVDAVADLATDRNDSNLRRSDDRFAFEHVFSGWIVIGHLTF